MITTKKGTVGKPQINVRTEFGFTQPTKKPQMMGSAEWAELYNEAYGKEYYTQAEIQKYRDGSDPDLYPNVDWFDALFKNTAANQNVKLNIPIEFTQYVSEIRLDPLNVSCVLQNLKVQIVTKDNNEYEIEHYRHNAIITKDHDFIFASEDPQIIFENQWENNVREVKIAFRIREAGLQDNPILSALSELKCHMNKVENELEYIKGTKVYKTLLERKVDKVLGENE